MNNTNNNLKTKVLHIGVKNWPFFEAFQDKNLEGIRGGGVNKYCSMLITNLPNDIESFLIVQKLTNQREFENVGNIKVFRVKTFGGRRLRQVITLLNSFFLAIFVIKKYKINVIHGHLLHGILMAYILGKLTNVKTIGTPYSFVTIGLPFFWGKLSKLIEKVIYQRINRLVFETYGNLEFARNIRSLEMRNAIVINTGINIPEKIKRGEKSECLRILYIGRMVRIKAIDNLLKGISLLKQKSETQFFLDLIGEGESLNMYKKLAKSYSLDNFVHFHGFVENVEEYWTNADLFILASHSEGLSITLLEAMSRGKACIVNDFSLPFSNKELYIMENNKPSTIANSILSLINDKKKIEELGMKAMKRIEKDFSIAEFIKKYVNLYKGIVQKVDKIY